MNLFTKQKQIHRHSFRTFDGIAGNKGFIFLLGLELCRCRPVLPAANLLASTMSGQFV